MRRNSPKVLQAFIQIAVNLEQAMRVFVIESEQRFVDYCKAEEAKEMAFMTPPILLVDLNPEDTDGKITVSLESYLQFGDEMAIGIDQLVQRWSHFASPAAMLSDARQERDEIGMDIDSPHET